MATLDHERKLSRPQADKGSARQFYNSGRGRQFPHPRCDLASLCGEGPQSAKLNCYRDCAAFSTSAAWPGTRTLRQIRASLPPLSIRKVERSMPMYLRPYMFFSTHEP